MNTQDRIMKLDSILFKYTHWHIKEMIDFAIPTLIGLYIFSVSYHTDYSFPPLYWHEMKGIHHTWDLLALFIFYFIMKFVFNFSSMKSLLSLVFIIAVNEESWYITYYFTHPTQIFAMTWIFSPVNIAYGMVIVFYLLSMKKANLPIPLFLIMLTTITFFIWKAIFGFPLTVDFFGSTQYFFNPLVNWIEIEHWLIAIFGFAVDCLLFKIFGGLEERKIG